MNLSFEDLEDWANSLCLGFKADGNVLVAHGKKTKLALELRAYTPSWKDGAQYISVSGLDRRDGYEGFTSPCDSIKEAERCVLLYASKYGIKKCDTQLSLF